MYYDQDEINEFTRWAGIRGQRSRKVFHDPFITRRITSEQLRRLNATNSSWGIGLAQTKKKYGGK